MTYCHNGFSSAGDLVDPIWVNSATRLSDGEKRLFAQQNEIYVSLWSSQELNRVLIWADQFPWIKFFVGGPLAPWLIRTEDFPNSVQLCTGLVEDVLGVDYDPKRWKCILPHTSTEMRIYSFYSGTTCYWGKCTFCSTHIKGSKAHLDRPYDLSRLESAPAGTIFLTNPSMSPKDLECLPTLNCEDKVYLFYAASNTDTYAALEQMLPKITKPAAYVARIGVEFPSEKMLRLMNKNSTLDILIKFINLLDAYGVRKHLTYISGWPETTREDVEEAKKFFDALNDKDDERTIHAVNRLHFPLDKPYIDKERKQLIYCYYPSLPEDVQKLDDEYVALFKNRKGGVSYNPAYPLW